MSEVLWNFCHFNVCEYVLKQKTRVQVLGCLTLYLIFLHGIKLKIRSYGYVVIAVLLCCVLRGHGGERNLDVVPRRDEARNSG